MTPEQLDATSIEVALAAGAKWVPHPFVNGWFFLIYEDTEVEVANKDDFGNQHILRHYATSRDAFHRDIVPEIKRKGKWGAFCLELKAIINNKLRQEFDDWSDSLVQGVRQSLDLEPHELCQAAIKVLEEE